MHRLKVQSFDKDMLKFFICITLVTVYSIQIYLRRLHIGITSGRMRNRILDQYTILWIQAPCSPSPLPSSRMAMNSIINHPYAAQTSSARGRQRRHTMSPISPAVAQTMIQLNECLYRGDEQTHRLPSHRLVICYYVCPFGSRVTRRLNTISHRVCTQCGLVVC